MWRASPARSVVDQPTGDLIRLDTGSGCVLNYRQTIRWEIGVAESESLVDEVPR
jgi:hypothetical protein